MLKSFYSPHTCPVCEREIFDSIVCRSCLSVLERERLKPERRCSVCFNPMREDACPFCSSRNVFFDRHTSLFRLSSHWMKFLHRWKFENDRVLYRFFISFLKETLDVLPADARFIYLDSGKSGYDVRAYQPCRDICRVLKGISGIDQGGSLKKIKRMRQSGRSYRERFTGIRNSYSAKNIQSAKKYILVEDVFTTGATGNEVAKILKNKGAEYVMILSLLMRESGE